MSPNSLSLPSPPNRRSSPPETEAVPPMEYEHGIADQQIVAIAADQGVGAAAAVRVAAEPEAREVERIADDGVVAVAAIHVVVAARGKIGDAGVRNDRSPEGTVKKPV